MRRARWGGWLLVLALAGASGLRAADPPPAAERVGTLADPLLKEASGIVASRKHPGVYWVHNDSGNEPRIFAVRRDGTTIRSYLVAAPNVDWEDIATDDAGHLFIGDIGNNTLKLPARVLYQIREPDPSAREAPAKPLPIIAAHHYAYPAGQAFDAEGLTIYAAQAYLVTKRRDGQPAELYRLPLEPVAPLLRPAIPFRVGILPNCTEPVTGASLTRDGRLLAVATGRSVQVFETDFLNNWFPAGSASHGDTGQVEGITWDGLDLILVGEDRAVLRVPQARWRSQRRGR